MAEQDVVLLAHGSGGAMMSRIIDDVFAPAFGGGLDCENDAAVLRLGKCAPQEGGSTGPRIAFSTDSFVVTPHFFPGGDIGRLAVCGTVNDVATSGAQVQFISCGFILEEGYALDDLKRICASMREAADEAGVSIVTGDTKVVGRGQGSGVYINTAGIGVLDSKAGLTPANCQAGDAILLSGTLGDHGITIISKREGLEFATELESDAAPLNRMVSAVREAAPEVRCFRDPTRGGLSSTLNEFAQACGMRFVIDEQAVPVKDQVRGACEMLGYDVFQVANEGKMVCVVPQEQAQAALDAMRSDPHGHDAAIVGHVEEGRPGAILRTPFGSSRTLDKLVGEQLPRIC